VRREKAHAGDGVATCERRVHQRQRPCREERVRGRDGDAERLLGAEVEVADTAGHERIGDARQIEAHAEQVEHALKDPCRPLEHLGRLVAIPAQAAEAARCEEPALGPDQLGRPGQLIEWSADVHAVESERFSDQLLDELREAAAGHALDDLADEIP
jgi:hypothetical protein